MAAKKRDRRNAMRGTRVCRTCGNSGHNARTCPNSN
jgi:hypothetical protein